MYAFNTVHCYMHLNKKPEEYGNHVIGLLCFKEWIRVVDVFDTDTLIALKPKMATVSLRDREFSCYNHVTVMFVWYVKCKI